MSLAYDKVDVVPVMSAALNVDKPVQYAAYLGGSTISYKEVISTSYSSSQASFTANPPDPNVIVDRANVLLKQPVRITFTGTSAAGSRLIQSGYDAFRAFPLHSVMNTLQLTMNNTKMDINASEIIHEMMKYYGEEREQEHMSMTPCYPDQSQEYSELVNSNRNCLAQFGEKNSGVPFRGGYPYSLLTNPVDGTEAVLEATLCEPLVISPLLWGGYDGKGLIHVQNMNVQINWEPNLARMWSHAAGSGSTITNIQVELLQPSLLFRYITPPPTMELPRAVDYDLQDTEVYTSEINELKAPGVEYPMHSSNIQLNVVPSHLMIFAKQRRGDRTYETTDSWQSIESLEMSFANVSGLFSGANKRALYNISKQNGLNASWTEWSAEPTYTVSGGNQSVKHGIGSLMILKFGKDIALNDPSVTIGTPGTYNLQVRVGLKNQNPTRSINPALYVVPIYSGVLTLKDNQSIQQLALLSQNDVLKAGDEANAEGAIDGAEFEGGKFWGDISRYAQQALPYLRKGRKVGQAIASAVPGPEAKAAKAALDVAEELGLGMKPKAMAKPRGGVLVGGKKVSRAEMRRALQM